MGWPLSFHLIGIRGPKRDIKSTLLDTSVYSMSMWFATTLIMALDLNSGVN